MNLARWACAWLLYGIGEEPARPEMCEFCLRWGHDTTMCAECWRAAR